MPHRLSLSEYQAVGRMLRAGVRQVEIARALDVSLWTIARVAQTLRRRSEGWTEGPLEEELPELDAPPDYVAKNLRRCPGCGAMVYLWPCLACRTAVQVRALPVSDEEQEDEHDDEAIWPAPRS